MLLGHWLVCTRSVLEAGVNIFEGSIDEGSVGHASFRSATDHMQTFNCPQVPLSCQMLWSASTKASRNGVDHCTIITLSWASFP